jgi:hypothetical protein
MPMHLEGSCRCGAVRFALDTHTPVPYQLCYCSICRKTAGGGGYAINLGGLSASLTVRGETAIYRAQIDRGGTLEVSTAQRHYCPKCATALWVYDPTWPALVHPFASAIDTPLPAAPKRVHLMLADRPEWVPLDPGPDDDFFDGYPELSLDDWHRKNGVWVA